MRTLVVEPVVSPVPDGDRPARAADVPSPPTAPTPRTAVKQQDRLTDA